MKTFHFETICIFAPEKNTSQADDGKLTVLSETEEVQVITRKFVSVKLILSYLTCNCH